MKAKRCTICGCDRTLLIKAEVIEQSKETQVTLKTKQICLPCFLRHAMDIYTGHPDLTLQEAIKKFYACVDEE